MSREFFEKPKKAKGVTSVVFHGELPTKITNLINVISKDNSKQTGQPFEKFINLVHSNLVIEKLTIIDSTYLHRHYSGKTDEFNMTWLDKNAPSLSVLEIPYEIFSWKSILEHNEYPIYRELIQSLYNEDEQFQILVRERIKKFICLSGEEAAISYLLEECAGACVLSRMGNITYPGPMNPPMRHCLNELVGERFEYIPYDVTYLGANNNPTKDMANYFKSLSFPQEMYPEFFERYQEFCNALSKEIKDKKMQKRIAGIDTVTPLQKTCDLPTITY